LTRGADDWPPTESDWPSPQSQGMAGRFAGIDMADFDYERQRAKRVLLLWIAVVLIVTGLVATAAWTVGSNISGLLS
jgi:serine/threonine-protein kinase